MSLGIPFGNYRIVRRLGAGGMAEVFLAKRIGPEGFEKQLVIKRILPHLCESKELTSLFLKEARLAARVDHPNVVHVSDFGEVDGTYYIAMEYIDGVTLFDVLDEGRRPLSVGAACRVGIDVLDGLHAIHSTRDDEGATVGLVHRDLSPVNIMLTRDGAVKLLDFGIATAGHDDLATRGTNQYMSPEHAQGDTEDLRSDLFSLGLLLCLMACGRLPWTGKPKGEPSRPDAMPEDLWTIVSTLLAIDPERRPASAREVQAKLEIYLSTRGAEGTRSQLAAELAARVPEQRGRRRTRATRLTAAVQTLMKRAGRGPLMLSLAWLLIVGLAVAGGVVWKLSTDEPPPRPTPIVLEPQPLFPSSDTAPTESATAEQELPVKTRRKSRTPRTKLAKTGTLTINTTPWTIVYLDGKELGMTPMQGITVPVGRHRLRLENPKLEISRKTSVQIKAGSETRLNLSL